MRSARFALCAASVRADNGRSVVVDGGTVRSDPCGFGECCAVARDMCSLRPNEADEVMQRSRFAVRDLEEEGRDNLPDSCEVGVGGLPGDWLKFIERMIEFCYNLLKRHSFQRWRARHLRGQVPPSLVSYRFLDK